MSRIVIADDDPGIGRILRDRLLRSGYEAEHVMDGIARSPGPTVHGPGGWRRRAAARCSWTRSGRWRQGCSAAAAAAAGTRVRAARQRRTQRADIRLVAATHRDLAAGDATAVSGKTSRQVQYLLT